MAKTQKDTTGETSMRKNKELGVLPTRNLILFPHLIMPIHIGREDSLQTVKRAEQTKEEIIVACQIDPEENNPTLDQLYNVASTAKVLNVLEMPEGHGHTA
ncbi:MAG: LON peptidase substrate-binding domain-containing protein, partial [Muribaculaceae bacterium]|nr:LON peptidase substrate-binding domain-containing protein [Muribaculaceae bacterium]